MLGVVDGRRAATEGLNVDGLATGFLGLWVAVFAFEMAKRVMRW